jgi:uncharacterized protein YcgI (DUF1989 family)
VSDELLIAAGHGGRMEVTAGQRLEIINVEGQQICDFFGFRGDDPHIYLSPAQTRAVHRRWRIGLGDKLYDERRDAVFEIVEDTVGRHDSMFCCCDKYRFTKTYKDPEHRSCRSNLAECVTDLDIPYDYLPDPFNFFQNSEPTAEGGFAMLPSVAGVGDKIVLLALVDMIAVGSACPMDYYPANGDRLTDLKFVVKGAAQ